MKEEQQALRAGFKNFIEAVTTTSEGAEVDLHLGVVTTDMGIGGVPGAVEQRCPGLGDDGVLV